MAVNIFNSVVPWLLGNSGKQIFLKDNVHNHGLRTNDEPLIYLMSHEDSVFFKGLRNFRNKVLYANVINDKRTAWWTAGISLNDPFFNINEYNGGNVFQYVPGYENVIVDGAQPIIISKDESYDDGVIAQKCDVSSKEMLESSFINYWFAKLCRCTVVIFNLCIVGPLILAWKIAQSCMEMTISTIRVTRFLNDYPTQLLQDFFEISAPLPLAAQGNRIEAARKDFDDTDRIGIGYGGCRDNELIDIGPCLSGSSSFRSIQTQKANNCKLEDSLNDQADNLMESIFDAIERKTFHGGFLQEPSVGESLTAYTKDHSLIISIRELENQTTEQLTLEHGSDMRELIENLHLDISPRQVDIIKSLNKIRWLKFPIYIRKTPSTHACAIVRHRDPLFDEGKVVVKHWIEQVFQIT